MKRHSSLSSDDIRASGWGVISSPEQFAQAKSGTALCHSPFLARQSPVFKDEPSPAAIRRLLAACRSHRLGQDRITRVRVSRPRRHAGDRVIDSEPRGNAARAILGAEVTGA